MRMFHFKLTAILILIAAPYAFAQNQPTNFFAAPRDNTSALIVATDPTRVCTGVTFVHPETGVIASGTATSGSSCLGNQPVMKPTCAADGQKDCVIAKDGKFSAVDKTSLESGSIRRGVTIGGVQGSYPSAATPLDPGSAPSALDTSGVTKANPNNFLLFGKDGTPYQFKVGKISDGDFTPTKTPSLFPSTMSATSPTTLFMPFRISGESNLSAENIIAPTKVLSVTGTSLPRSFFKPEAGTTPAGTTPTTVNNSQNKIIAQAVVFMEFPTQSHWMLLRDTTTTAPRLSETSSNAATLCSGANVTINKNSYNSQTGAWALPTSNQVKWMLKTGATAPDGLIARENLFSVGSTTIKFWVYDAPATGTTGTYKTAYFTDILSEPVIESAVTNATANVVCVFKLATSGTGGGTAFTPKTDNAPVMFGTTLPDKTRTSLAAHVYLEPNQTRAFAYVFKSDTNSARSFPYPKDSAVTYANAVCGDLKNQMQTSILPSAFATYNWMPISKTLVDAFAAGFTVAPFLGSVGDGSKYQLGQNFLAFDNTVSGSGPFKVYQFSTAGGGATEASTAMGGAVICTAGQ